MKSATGRWVIGDDFFGRDRELRILERRVREGNHTLLTGQRRMGKTSIARELGGRLKAEGWTFLFVDVEGHQNPEEFVKNLINEAQPYLQTTQRARYWFQNTIPDKIGLSYRGTEFSFVLNAGNWRRQGEQLVRDCAASGRRILLVIDELPIFLMRMRDKDGDANRVEAFLSWLRALSQNIERNSLVLMVSGSIGLAPLVERLGISDRINHFLPYRLPPWNRPTGVACFERLAASYELTLQGGVAEAAYDKLGIGIPHHVQSFFVRLQEHAKGLDRSWVTLEDVSEVYRNDLLGPWGQNDLNHYETRLMDALDEASRPVAMHMLTEAAVQGSFSAEARRSLERRYSRAPAAIADILAVLEHDGYLEAREDGHRIPSNLLGDWWAKRFAERYPPLCEAAPGTPR